MGSFSTVKLSQREYRVQHATQHTFARVKLIRSIKCAKYYIIYYIVMEILEYNNESTEYFDS